ncbi:hypothetical protein BJ138DRAFT_1107006 [Hygrophoropsis aurantiaca]|uniref:Uncharacterized protein n=1 Tax=Hygrophoropsis aurantiaca TaxID=72124 RepID=A0ACB7ZU40_9AGAM|nr:hypothetical protein BJ138DRAFT_1107006 [Hygrophoropsis aurantiaca]
MASISSSLGTQFLTFDSTLLAASSTVTANNLQYWQFYGWNKPQYDGVAFYTYGTPSPDGFSRCAGFAHSEADIDNNLRSFKFQVFEEGSYELVLYDDSSCHSNKLYGRLSTVNVQEMINKKKGISQHWRSLRVHRSKV